MDNIWTNIFGSKLPTVVYCESAIQGLIARPGYFISNILFILVGIFLLTRKTRLGKIMGIITIIVGLASALYDASFRFNSQIIDLSSMFILVNFLLIYNLYKSKVLNKTNSIILALILQIIYMFSIFFLEGQSGRILFGLAIIGVILTEYYYVVIVLKKRISKYFLIAFGLFLLGFIIWMFDSNLIYCSAITLLNGRAIFHYLTAISIGFLYKNNLEKYLF